MTNNALRRTLTVEDLRLAQSRLSNPDSLTTKIYEMRLQGQSTAEIALAVGKTQDEVELSIVKMAEATRTRLISELSIATVLEIDRMDALLKALWPAALMGESGAVDRVMAISKARRTMMGLDAPDAKTALLHQNDPNADDLTVLSLDELASWERIQKKLADARKGNRPVKSLPGTVEVIEPPTARRAKQPGAKRSREQSSAVTIDLVAEPASPSTLAD